MSIKDKELEKYFDGMYTIKEVADLTGMKCGEVYEKFLNGEYEGVIKSPPSRRHPNGMWLVPKVAINK